MGVDAVIFINLRHEWEFDLLPGAEIEEVLAGEDAPVGATHRVVGLGRYYDESYRSGSWPFLCSILMQLLREEPQIRAVWYGRDNEDMGKLKRFRKKDLHNLIDSYWRSL